MEHRTFAELEAGLDEIRQSPQDNGVVDLLVIRPAVDERMLPSEVELDAEVGVVGDNWHRRGSRHTTDGGPHPDCQIAVTNARMTRLLDPDPARRALAGDQLHLDLDLGVDNLPPGSRLALGSAVLEITAHPHNGCTKFRERFGVDAVRFVNSPVGKQLHLRGVNARVVQNGTVRVGDTVRKLPPR